MTVTEFEQRGVERRLAMLRRQHRREDRIRLARTFAWVGGFVAFALAVNWAVS